MDIMRNSQQKMIMTTLILLFIISMIGKKASFAEEQDNLGYQEEVSDEYRRANYDGDQVQLSRTAQVTRSCVWRAGQGVLRPMNPYFSTKFYPASMTLDEKKGVGWCRIAEVETAAGAILFLLLKDVPITEIKEALASHDVKTVLMQKLDMRPRKRKNLMEQRQHGDFNFNYIIVRHPFLRLVEAFTNKIEKNVKKKANVKFSKSSRLSSSIANIQTFPEFVDHLIRTPPNLMDKHWAPYTKVCIPCNISYSAIIKLDTLAQDLDWLLHKLGLNHNRDDFYNITASKKHNKNHELLSIESLARKYFSQISRVNVRRLYEKYKVDFEMFGYEGEVKTYIDMGYS